MGGGTWCRAGPLAGTRGPSASPGAPVWRAPPPPRTSPRGTRRGLALPPVAASANLPYPFYATTTVGAAKSGNRGTGIPYMFEMRRPLVWDRTPAPMADLSLGTGRGGARAGCRAMWASTAARSRAYIRRQARGHLALYLIRDFQRCTIFFLNYGDFKSVAWSHNVHATRTNVSKRAPAPSWSALLEGPHLRREGREVRCRRVCGAGPQQWQGCGADRVVVIFSTGRENQDYGRNRVFVIVWGCLRGLDGHRNPRAVHGDHRESWARP